MDDNEGPTPSPRKPSLAEETFNLSQADREKAMQATAGFGGLTVAGKFANPRNIGNFRKAVKEIVEAQGAGKLDPSTAKLGLKNVLLEAESYGHDPGDLHTLIPHWLYPWSP